MILISGPRGPWGREAIIVQSTVLQIDLGQNERGF